MPNIAPRRTQIWMLGTDPGGKGGVASVLHQYAEAGVFDDGTVRFEVTHRGTSTAGRIIPPIVGAFRLWANLCLGRVELIHAHTSYGLSFWRKLLITLPAVLMRKPIIVHLHSGKFMEFYASGGAWRRKCMRFLFRRARRVIVVSMELGDWVRETEPSAIVEIVYNSLAASTGQHNSAGFSPQPTILFLGRVDPKKGAFDLLDALSIVKRTLPTARLFLGGDGDVERFLATAVELGLHNAVHYAGWVEGADKSALLEQCWVLALPSYQEGLPMTILEAMAYSRAVVATPVGGIPQAVKDGTTGLLHQPGDVRALADNLLQVLLDIKTAARMGRAGRQLFEQRYSNEANLSRLMFIYRDAGAKRTPQLRLGPSRHAKSDATVSQPESQ